MTPRTSDETNIELMKQDIRYIRDDVSQIKAALQTNYVTKDQFAPVKRIAYGALSAVIAILVTAVGFIISKAH